MKFTEFTNFLRVLLSLNSSRINKLYIYASFISNIVNRDFILSNQQDRRSAILVVRYLQLKENS